MSSHRVSSDAPLVRHGDAQAVVRAALRRGDRELLVEIEINPGRANRVRVNRAPLPRPRELLGLVRTVLFAPEDLALVRGDPTERRRFLDELLVTRTPRLAGVRADYDRVLKQRNALLKTARLARGKAIETLDVWDGHLTDVGGQLLAARLQLVADLAPHVARSYAEVAGEGAVVGRPRLLLDRAAGRGRRGARPPGATLPTAAELTAAMRERVAERRSDELDRGMTLVGPHRDDLVIHLGPAPAKGFASHGESWSLALALKLATFALLRAEGEDPDPDPGRRLRDPRRRAPRGAGGGRPLGRADADHRRGGRRRPGRAARRPRRGRRRHRRRGEGCRPPRGGAVSEERPARPSDIARAALEAARAASAARPQPTRRRIAGPRRKWTGAGPGRRRPAAARPAGRLAGHRAGLVGAHPGRRGVRPLGGAGRPGHRRALRAADPHRGRAARRRRVHGVGHPAAAAGPDDPGQAARPGGRGRRDPVARCRSDGPQLEEGPAHGARAGTARHVRLRTQRRRRRGSDEQLRATASGGDGLRPGRPRAAAGDEPEHLGRRRAGRRRAEPARAGRVVAAGRLGPARRGPAPDRTRHAPDGRPRSGRRAALRRAVRAPRRPDGAGVPLPRPTSSAPRAGRCSTAGRSPTASGPEDAVLRDLIATAPVRPGKEAPAGQRAARPGGHAGAGRLRHRLPAGPVAGAEVRGDRGAPARRRAGAPALPGPVLAAPHRRARPGPQRRTRRSTPAGCCSRPRTARRCAGSSQDPTVQGLLLGTRRRRRVLDRRPGISRRSGPTATGRS